MLTKTQIAVATGVLHVLQQEGATFGTMFSLSRGLSADEASQYFVVGTTFVLSRGLSADEASQYFVDADADNDATVVEFREEAACFTIQFSNDELANSPAECIDRAMKVRRALICMSSN